MSILNLILITISGFIVVGLLFYFSHQRFCKKYEKFIKEYSSIIFKNDLVIESAKVYKLDINGLKDILIYFIIDTIVGIFVNVLWLIILSIIT